MRLKRTYFTRKFVIVYHYMDNVPIVVMALRSLDSFVLCHLLLFIVCVVLGLVLH